MKMITKSIAISSIAFVVVILSTDGLSLNNTFSESFLDQSSSYVQSKFSKPNQTLSNTGCDFLNLCGKYLDNGLSGAGFSFNNKIVDISYYGSYLKLPFP
jgi:hypothetical protein